MNDILNLILESINENEQIYSEILYKNENIINLKIKIKWLSEELLEYYLVIEKEKKDKNKVKVREVKNKNKLPLLCPQRHINIGGYFCLGYENIDNLSIINKETACKFVNRLIVYLKLQRKAEILGSWDCDKSWSHGNSANEHK